MGRVHSEFLTQDLELLQLLEKADRIAPTQVSILIQGESGTGKERIAQRIHAHSLQSQHSMVSLNCGALSEPLLLSELFGYERGAFTGAVHQKKGLVETANGGTLFLDEIGEMGLESQAKLLRFLQEGQIYRLGSELPIKVSTRILSASNKNLSKAVEEGKFRQDLFYRINTVTLTISPLRNRPEDIVLLAEYFLKQLQSNKKLSNQTKIALQEYPWPGNVRELQNAIERLHVLVDSEMIEPSDFPLGSQGKSFKEMPDSLLLDQVEKNHILKVLKQFKGNKTRAARAMGITVKTLYNKLATYETGSSSSL